MTIHAFVTQTNQDIMILSRDQSVNNDEKELRMYSIAAKVVGLIAGFFSASQVLNAVIAGSMFSTLVGAVFLAVAHDLIILGGNLSISLTNPNVMAQGLARIGHAFNHVMASLRGQNAGLLPQNDAEALMDGMILAPTIYAWTR